MPQLFCLKEPDTAADATPRTLAGSVIVRAGLFCVGAQPPVGAACDGSAGAMSRPPAMATVETMWRARIAGPPRGQSGRAQRNSGWPGHLGHGGNVGFIEVLASAMRHSDARRDGHARLGKKLLTVS